MRRTPSACFIALVALWFAVSPALSGPPPPLRHQPRPPPSDDVEPEALSTDVKTDYRIPPDDTIRLSDSKSLDIPPIRLSDPISIDSTSIRLSAAPPRLDGDFISIDSSAPLGPNFPIANFQDPSGPNTDLSRPVLAYNSHRGTWLTVWHAYSQVGSYNLYAREVGPTGAMPTASITVCQAAGDQYDSALAYDAANDQFYLSWTDDRSGTEQVYAQRLGSTGAPLGNALLVSASQGYAPRVACSGQRCVVVYGNDDGDVRWPEARAINSGGALASGIVRLTPAGTDAQWPDVAYNPTNDQFLAVWEEWHGDNGWDVAGRALSPGLSLLGAEIPICNQGLSQRYPSVAFHVARARYCVVWQDGRSNTDWNLYAQMLGPDGALVGGNVLAYAGPDNETTPHVAAHATRDQFMIAFTTSSEIRVCTITTGGTATGNVQLRTGANWRNMPQVAPRSGSDDYLVVWRENFTNGQPDIDAQRVRQDRVLAGGGIIVAAGRKGQEVPAVAYNAQNDRFLVAWRDYHSGTDHDVRGRLVGPDGALLGQEVIISRRGNLRNMPWVVALPTRDDFLVTYLAHENNVEILAQRVSVAGQLSGAEILVSRDTPSNDGGSPRAATNPARNEYLVAWTADTNDTWNIYAQRLSAEGALLGRNLAICVAEDTQQSACVCFSPRSNEYLITWQDYRSREQGEIRAQRVSAEGALLGAELLLASASGGLWGHRTVWNEQANEYLLVWGDDVGQGRIFGRRLDANAAALGGPFAISAPEWGASTPALGYDRVTHEYLLTWVTDNATTDQDVWGARLGADGLVQGAPFGLSVRGDIQNNPNLAQDTHSGQFLIVWQDALGGSWDVYGQRWTNAAAPSPTPTRTATPGRTPTLTRTFVVRNRAYLPIIRRPRP